ncbi:MAG: hypothetical protein JWN83_1248, partial [Chitinophagaceae bacterium]|nr:hypothetical protein [Chitinophagaceae bacterium]
MNYTFKNIVQIYRRIARSCNILKVFAFFVPILFLAFFSDTTIAQTITVTNVNVTPVCAGKDVTVTFNATNVSSNPVHFSSNTDFTVYLSSPGGSGPYTAIGTLNLNAYNFCKQNTCTNTGVTGTITIPGTASGNYNIALSSSSPTFDGSTGAGKSPNFNVQASPPVPTISASGPVSFCPGGSVTLTSSSNSGNQWYLNNVATGQNTQSITATAAGSYTVKNSSGNCSSTSAATVVTVSQPDLSLTAGNPCAGTVLFLNASSTTPGVSYSWSGPNGFASTDQNPYIDAVTTAASGTYTVTAATSPGCIATAQINVTVQPAPPALTFTGPTEVCAGSPATYMVSPGSNFGNYSYTFDPTDGLTINSYTANPQKLTVTWNNPGLYHIYAIYKDANATCGTPELDIAVTVKPSPIVTVNPAAPTICSGDNVVLTASANVAATFTWTPTTNLSPTTGATVTASPTTNTTYTVTGTDATGCYGKQTVDIIVNQKPSLTSSTTPPAVCSNFAFTYTAISSITGTTFSWTRPAVAGISNATATGNTASINETLVNTTSGPVNVTYTFTLTAPNGCTRIQNVTVTVNACGAITNNTISTVSNNCVVIIQGSDAAGCAQGVTYAWYVSNTNSVYPAGYTLVVGITTRDFSPNATYDGKYLYRVATCNNTTVTDGAGPVQYHVAMTASVNKTNVKCNGANDGTASVTVSGGLPAYKYAWKNSSGTIIGTNSSITNLAPGNYTVTVTDNDAPQNCSTILSFTITEPAAITGTAAITKPLKCYGDDNGTITITASGGTGTLQYSLNNSVYQTSNVIIDLTSGTYPVWVKDANGCTVKLQDIQLTTSSQIIFSTTATKNCYQGNNGTIAVNNVSGGSGSGYTYGINNTYQSSPTFAGLAPGNYNISVKDGTGCNESVSVTIGQYTQVSVAISAPSTTVCVGTTTTLTANVTGATTGLTYQWYSGVNPVGSNSNTYNVSTSGDFTVKVTDANNCSVTSAPVTMTVPAFFITDPAPVCAPATVNLTDPAVTAGSSAGSTFEYYKNANGTGPLNNPDQVNKSGAYYIKQTTASGCTDIKPVTVTINNKPVLTITNPATVCPPGSVNITAAAVTSGSDAGTLSYWTDATATTAVSNPAAITTGGVYFIKLTNTTTGCYDIQQVTVSIIQTPLPAAAGTQSFCSASNPTVANLTATGSNLQWYTVAANGSPLASSTPLTAGNYYVSQTSGGCESGRTQVSVVITSTPTADAPGNVQQCSPYTLPALTNGNYFSAQNGVGPIAAGTVISTNQTIYVYAGTAGCSDEHSFTVNITTPIADAPGNVQQCSPYTLPALTNGNYFSAQNGVGPIAAGTVISTNQTIYVYAGTAGCSDEHSFTVNITTPVADAPGNVQQCSPYTLPALTNGNYFSAQNGVGPITAGTVISTNQTIYVYAGTAGCSDEHSFTVNITTPTADAPGNVQQCSPYTLPALTNGNYFSAQNGVGPIAAGTVSSPNQTIYVYAGTAGCSDEHSFTVNITTPVADAPGNVQQCSPYTLPALTNGNYFSAQNGVGPIAAGTV